MKNSYLDFTRLILIYKNMKLHEYLQSIHIYAAIFIIILILM